MHFLRDYHPQRNWKNVCAERCKSIIFLLIKMREKHVKIKKKTHNNKMEFKIRETKMKRKATDNFESLSCQFHENFFRFSGHRKIKFFACFRGKK